MTPNSTGRPTIPVTVVRHFYELLRNDFQSSEFHLQTARECCRKPDILQGMLKRSSDHFNAYDNRSEGFHSRGCGGSLTTRRGSSQDQANRLLNLLAGNRVEVTDRPELLVEYVDYEVSPIRTTGTTFESGESGRSSGAGGVDALLANRVDRLPVIGEIKADTDRNPFLGLAQALTYAVELSTPPQRARLERAYPGRFVWPEGGPFVDVYLMLIRYPDDRQHCEFLSLVDQISRSLLIPGAFAASLVRRVVCLHTQLDSTESAAFNVRFAHPG